MSPALPLSFRTINFQNTKSTTWKYPKLKLTNHEPKPLSSREVPPASRTSLISLSGSIPLSILSPPSPAPPGAPFFSHPSTPQPGGLGSHICSCSGFIPKITLNECDCERTTSLFGLTHNPWDPLAAKSHFKSSPKYGRIGTKIHKSSVGQRLR